MFKPIRDRLLLYYLLVFGVVLLSFAATVRIAFARSLNRELMGRLETLALTTSFELEIDEESGQLEAEDEDVLIQDNQSVQWFDQDGELLAEQGELTVNLDLPLALKADSIQQRQKLPEPLMSVTMAVRDRDTDQHLGYARVSESTRELSTTLRRLDQGLAGGIALALGLSAAGGLWVTRKAMQPIEQSFQRLQRFTSDASHELRSPLMAIRTNAAVALKYPQDMRPGDGEKFGAIQSAANQMKAMTEDLLQLARFDQKIANSQEELDLKALLAALLVRYEPQAEAKQVQIEQQLEIVGDGTSDTGACIVGAPMDLNRLFCNLLDNALRYTPAGGKITVCLETEGNHYRVQIEDTGIGIAPKHLDKIFERFWQAEASRNYQSSGAGLGLALAQEIAQAHGGHIAVTSVLNQGSCFKVYLPQIP